jgi:hypothetical protein
MGRREYNYVSVRPKGFDTQMVRLYLNPSIVHIRTHLYRILLGLHKVGFLRYENDEYRYWTHHDPFVCEFDMRKRTTYICIRSTRLYPTCFHRYVYLSICLSIVCLFVSKIDAMIALCTRNLTYQRMHHNSAQQAWEVGTTELHPHTC